MSQMRNLAYFISPHGYGHAARVAAVLLALRQIEPNFKTHIFTKVPKWFFETSFLVNFTYHTCLTDVGLAQKTSLQEDIPETLRRLDEFIPFDKGLIHWLAEELHRLNCTGVVCDIAPLGIAVAKAAGLPVLLVENFTWDWIYRGYMAQYPAIAPYADYFAGVLEQADYYIQTKPFCAAYPQTDLVVPPISRPIRRPANLIRQELNLALDTPLVMITMGGVPWNYDVLEPLKAYAEVYFIIPGGAETETRQGNLILLPHHNRFFHPDLVNASDLVIGKLGYSTLAEVYQVGLPFGYIPRPHFRESEILGDYVDQTMLGRRISEAAFLDGTWLDYIPDLLAMGRVRYAEPNGAPQAAAFIDKVL